MAFPLGIAAGPDFCSRKKDLIPAARKLAEGRNLWIQAEHRVGLTSYLGQLQNELAQTHEIPSISIDLGKIGDSAQLQSTLIQAYADLAEKVVIQNSNALQSAGRSVKEAFRFFVPRLSFEAMGVKLSMANLGDNSQDLINAKLALDHIMEGAAGRATLIIDGLEKLEALDTGASSIAGNLKTLLETDSISVVLAGATPELLQQAAATKNQLDLYSRCDKAPLSRIPSKSWIPFIKEKFLDHHGFILPTPSVKLLLALTENSTEHVVNLSKTLMDTDPLSLGDEESINNVLKNGWMEILRTNLINVDFLMFELDGQIKRELLVELSKGGPVQASGLIEKVDGSTHDDVADLLMDGYLTQDKIGCRLRLSSPLLKTYIALDQGAGILSCLADDCTVTHQHADSPETSL